METVRPQRLLSHGNALEPTVAPAVFQIHPSSFGGIDVTQELGSFSVHFFARLH